MSTTLADSAPIVSLTLEESAPITDTRARCSAPLEISTAPLLYGTAYPFTVVYAGRSASLKFTTTWVPWVPVKANFCFKLVAFLGINAALNR